MPFILALTLYVQAVQVFASRALAAALGAAAMGGAGTFWWGVPLLRARQQGYLPHPRHKEGRPPRPRQGRRKAGRRTPEPARAKQATR